MNDLSYMTAIRRQLHRYPETGFDLPQTVAFVKGELDKLGISYTESYCRSSLVATIDPGKKPYTVALRADMDALPIFEKNDSEYRSQHEGKMHACGHDAHTAMLLGAAKKLMSRLDELECRVKLIFQPSEEGMATGAKVMVENGVMDDVDFILGEHVDNRMDVGAMSIGAGAMYASNNVFEIVMTGLSAHASQPEKGIDAVGMAVDCYARLREMVKNEVDENEKKVLNIGIFEGGTAVNSVPCLAKMTCTLRTYKNEVADYIMKRVCDITSEVARNWGGSGEVKRIKDLPCVMNDASYVEKIRKIGEGVFHHVLPEYGRMGSEDFACYQSKKPGVMYTIGSGNQAKGIVKPLHSDEFDLDETVLEYGASMLSEAAIALGKDA